jgi:response regulator RpfG family c-di-GMP phosphodiesterase
MLKAKVRILIVDDEPDIRDILRTFLQDSGFECTTAASADQSLAELASREFDVVFTDIRMPGRPVGDLLRQIRQSHPGTAAVMITALNTAEAAIESIRLGASDYIVKPFRLNEVLAAVDRAMEKRRLDRANREFQKYFEEMAEDRAAQANRLFYSITQIPVRILELRLPFDIGHSTNVAEIARHIAFELKITKEGIRKVHLAALLHDVGMIPMEDLLLQKQGSLTTDEYRQIQEHSALAESVLKPILADAEVLKYIRHHHERYDGSGYPDRLKGNIIPLGARIIAVAEAFDAMTRGRPYRKALSPRLALAELNQCTETQFDPLVVAAFSRIFEQVAPDHNWRRENCDENPDSAPC